MREKCYERAGAQFQEPESLFLASIVNDTHIDDLVSSESFGRAADQAWATVSLAEFFPDGWPRLWEELRGYCESWIPSQKRDGLESALARMKEQGPESKAEAERRLGDFIDGCRVTIYLPVEGANDASDNLTFVWLPPGEPQELRNELQQLGFSAAWRTGRDPASISALRLKVGFPIVHWGGVGEARTALARQPRLAAGRCTA